jgi:hypothetical protein
MGQRGGADPQVVGADVFSVIGELRPEVRVDASDRIGDRDGAPAGEEMLNKRASAGAAGSRGAMDAMEEFADRDHADRAVLLAEHALDRGGADTSVEIDQQIGVDQDGHGLSAGLTDSRAARTSAEKSSSGFGALAIRSRNLDADTSWALGGAINATGAPPRVTSISSPAATRLSTTENLRAASVAVIRDTSGAYQINLMRRYERRHPLRKPHPTNINTDPDG